ncbi:MAG: FecR domain-containing protein [Spirochaetes bacterium]|nr:FecR domain-containing protein [Spirochaetota bacterium]
MLHGKIRFIILSSLLIVLFCTNAEAIPEIGKIIQLTGDVDLTDVNTGMRIVPGIGAKIQDNYKIRTGNKAYLEILLNDNTKIFIRELSIIQVSSLKIRSDDQPTTIIFSTGKIRIKINKQFKNWNLLVKTNPAIIGVKDIETDFGVITTDYETRSAVFTGEAHVANSNREIIKSYDVKLKEETSIKMNMPPMEPIVLPQEILDAWLDYYDVVGKDRIIIKGREDRGMIDYILRKRKF